MADTRQSFKRCITKRDSGQEGRAQRRSCVPGGRPVYSRRMKLPLLEARAPETTLCTFCPKLCRPACPVSTVEGRETVTPWGKMRAMGEISRGVAPPDTAHVAPAYACTGCMACFELCELGNPVAETLREGRAEAFRLEVAPKEARAFVRDFVRREKALADAAAGLPRSEGRVALLPGCTAVVFEQKTLPALAEGVAQIAGPCVLVAEACCGLPLLEAGDRRGFESRAQAMAARLASFERVVVSDAGCAHAMREIYPTFDLTLPPVEHLAQTAAGALDEIPPLIDPPRAVAYHDSCRLGRGLGIFDEPRALLDRLLGRPPLELPMNRRHAPCSGAGALLPRTRPTTASAIAAELGSLAAEVGASLVVTSCVSSRRQLASVGVRAIDLATLFAHAFVPQLQRSRTDK